MVGRKLKTNQLRLPNDNCDSGLARGVVLAKMRYGVTRMGSDAFDNL